MIIEKRLENIPIITLVGSTKWPDLWLQYQSSLLLAGYIVNTVGLFGHHTGLDMAGPDKKLLDRVYLKKIIMSDSILVLNHQGYIGLGAWDEIFLAIAYRKMIKFIEPVNEDCLKMISTLCTLEYPLYVLHNCVPNETEQQLGIHGQILIMSPGVVLPTTVEYPIFPGTY